MVRDSRSEAQAWRQELQEAQLEALQQEPACREVLEQVLMLFINVFVNSVMREDD